MAALTRPAGCEPLADPWAPGTEAWTWWRLPIWTLIIAGGWLEVLNRYRVGMVVVGLEKPEAPLYPQWRAAVDGQELQVAPVWAGYRILLDENVVLEVLHPPAPPSRFTSPDQNNNGLVLRLVYHQVSFLLTADIEGRGGDIPAAYPPTAGS